jgi:hypothetical protein
VWLSDPSSRRGRVGLAALLALGVSACGPAAGPGEDLSFLSDRYGFGVRGPEQPAALSGEEARADLLQLQSILQERFAYLEWLGVDHRAALEVIREGLGDEIETGDLALQIHKLLSLFGDGHTQVPSLPDYLPAAYLPLSLGDAREGIVAYHMDGSGLVDPERPVVTALDGVPLPELMDAVSVLVQRGSPQLVRRRSLRLLQHPPLWRCLRGLPDSPSVVVTLAALDGSGERTVDVDLVPDQSERVWHWLDDERWPHVEHRTVEPNTGYLRIRRMAADSAFVAHIHRAMDEFRGTDALIIDVRGNGGGSRAALMNLFPYLMAPGTPPRITNVARYRLTPEDEPGNPEGYLQNRFLYPATAPHLGEAEREAMGAFAGTFEPAWEPPEEGFSDWHYLIHTARDTLPFYHYDRPVVVLQDEDTFSATDIFLSGFEGWPGVTLMGMPSSGGSGRTNWFHLDNSNIPVRISSMASYLTDGRLMDGTGVHPDVRIQPRHTDFARETDTVLDAALEFLGSAATRTTGGPGPVTNGLRQVASAVPLKGDEP